MKRFYFLLFVAFSAQAPSHHTPDFFIDERGFTLGINALCNLTLDYMSSKK